MNPFNRHTTVSWETQVPLHEWILRERESQAQVREPIAYAVSAGAWTVERLAGAAKIQSADGTVAHPTVVPVSSIPLTATGAVDFEALDRVPVLNEAVARQWEERLCAAAGGKPIAVILHEAEKKEPRVHLSELLPDWRPLLESQITPTGAEAPPATAETSPPKPRPPAYSNGGPLTLPPGAPTTLTEALKRVARERPHKGVVFIRPDGGETFLSYAGLLEAARRILGGLQKLGLKPGARVILQLEALPDHFASFWACVLGGLTPVTVAVPPT